MIFLSYRREDSNEVVGHIYTRLAGKFGEMAVFRDQNQIPFGTEFPSIIETYFLYSSLMLVVIGPQWLNSRDASGDRRIDTPTDWVRREVELALQKQLLIIPVLVQGASMPAERSLPNAITDIANLNAATIRSGPAFDASVEDLFPVISAAMRNRVPPNGINCALGTVVDKYEVRTVGTPQSPGEIHTNYRVRFFNPATNQEDTTSITEAMTGRFWNPEFVRHTVGDLIKLRYKYSSWFGFFPARWEEDV